MERGAYPPPMPKWLKVVLLVVGVLAVLCVGSGLVFAGWLNANKDELKADGDKAKTDGDTFGRASDAAGCLTEGLRRLDQDQGIVKQALNHIFVEHCLLAAKRPDDFCKDVPLRGELTATATWAVEQCTARNRSGNQDCARMMQVVQKVCFPK